MNIFKEQEAAQPSPREACQIGDLEFNINENGSNFYAQFQALSNSNKEPILEGDTDRINKDIIGIGDISKTCNNIPILDEI